MSEREQALLNVIDRIEAMAYSVQSGGVDRSNRSEETLYDTLSIVLGELAKGRRLATETRTGESL